MAVGQDFLTDGCVLAITREATSDSIQVHMAVLLTLCITDRQKAIASELRNFSGY
jgi:hypothetical protein